MSSRFFGGPESDSSSEESSEEESEEEQQQQVRAAAARVAEHRLDGPGVTRAPQGGLAEGSGCAGVVRTASSGRL
eukprot:scaffold32520_cov108-Isochrysis_galbana.AAC.7